VQLNVRAWRLCQQLEDRADELQIQRHRVAGADCWDFGIHVAGGLAAGIQLARIGLADLAGVQLLATPGMPGSGWSVQVTTDHPVTACMASQYAGWRISRDGYFAMGSGPMRAAAASEELFRGRVDPERTDVAVGVLETASVPGSNVVVDIAQQCGVQPDRLVLLVAPTASQAGTLQIVARSVETALHKLIDLGFDLHRLVSGAGIAPLPPVAADDLEAIGRTNDAILYGARVTLWVRGDDASLDQVVQQVPSSSSRDYGEPFAKIFARYHHDFYQIDPHLFSPAQVSLVNLDTGRSFSAGQIDSGLLTASFSGSSRQ
jgi:methenyltetrahydromethanopterin cyclohydrolase